MIIQTLSWGFVCFNKIRYCLGQGGALLFEGQTPQELSIPSWRASVIYISQTRVNLKGTPAELYFSAQKFASQRGRERGDLPALVFQLGLEQVVLNQPWSELSVRDFFWNRVKLKRSELLVH